MGTAAKTPEKAEYPIYTMEDKGKLILPPEIIAQITYLHSHCGGKEWSGILVYDVKGNPSKPESFELIAKHIFLMDIGTAGATDYETDGDIVDIFDQIPEAMEMKLGHIHTHHSGSAYFSGTDEGELQDNVDKHNYYLSLVVNYNGNYAAKVVFLSDMHTTSKMNYKDDGGEIKHFKQSKIEKHMVVIDMRIFYGEVGGFFSDRLEAVQGKIAAKEKAEKKSWKGYSGNNHSGFQNSNSRLPAIGSKVIPDKMTGWEIEKLTKNVLMFDAELKTESNVYAVLHQIVNQEEDTASMDLYYDYLLNHIDKVFNAFFDTPLANDERIVVATEVIMCFKKYEGIPALVDIINNLEETFDHYMLKYEVEIDDSGEGSIADQLEKMENEL